MHQSTKTRAIIASVLRSASVKAVFWKSISGLPNAFRSLVYSVVSFIARSIEATAPTASDSRSCGSCCMSCTKPWPSSLLSRFSGGTVTMRADDHTLVGYAIGWGTTIPQEPYVPEVKAGDWKTIFELEAEWKKSKG